MIFFLLTCWWVTCDLQLLRLLIPPGTASELAVLYFDPNFTCNLDESFSSRLHCFTNKLQLVFMTAFGWAKDACKKSILAVSQVVAEVSRSPPTDDSVSHFGILHFTSLLLAGESTSLSCMDQKF